MKTTTKVIDLLNDALAREMRAQAMYAHYAAYVKGINRLHLRAYFENEAAESVVHAQTVRNALVRLGGLAVTNRDPQPIEHSTDYRVMLQEALKTEQESKEAYREILPLLQAEEDLYDAIEQILFAEERSVEELLQVM